MSANEHPQKPEHTNQRAAPVPPEQPVPEGFDWPGTHEWTDEDYKAYHSWHPGYEFMCTTGKWDWDLILPGEPGYDHSKRPVQISEADWQLIIPDGTAYGNYSLKRKLSAIAFKKWRKRRDEEEARMHEEAKARNKVRGAVAPRPVKAATPVQQWVHQNVTPHAPKSVEEEQAIIREIIATDQPYRYAQADLESQQLIETYGQVTHPETMNLDTATHDQMVAQPMPRHWTPEATPEQVIYGAASDLSALVSVLAARTVNATGFQSDADGIRRSVELSISLRNVTYVLREMRKQQELQLPTSHEKSTPYPIETNIAKRRRRLKRTDA